MALLHIDGFDTYDSVADINASGIYEAGTTFYDIISGGRFQTSNGYARIASGLPTKYIGNVTTIFCGFAIMTTDYKVSVTLVDFLNSAKASQFNIYISADGKLQARRGGTVIATGATVLSINVWRYIVIKVVFSDSVGAVEVWVNGVKEIDASGVDTQNTAVSGCDYFRFGAYTINARYDDWYIADDSGSTNNTLITEARVVPLVPTADTAQKDFTASIGSDNYAMVDEVSPHN